MLDSLFCELAIPSSPCRKIFLVKGASPNNKRNQQKIRRNIIHNVGQIASVDQIGCGVDQIGRVVKTNGKWNEADHEETNGHCERNGEDNDEERNNEKSQTNAKQEQEQEHTQHEIRTRHANAKDTNTNEENKT